MNSIEACRQSQTFVWVSDFLCTLKRVCVCVVVTLLTIYDTSTYKRLFEVQIKNKT